MTETYYTTSRDELVFLVQAIPLDVNCIIIHQHRTGVTRYRFPAVLTPRGGEIIAHGYRGARGHWIETFKTPEAHRDWQIKRRAQIAKQIKRGGKRLWE